MNSNRDVLKVRYHDGIVGVLYMSSALLAMTIQLDFIWIALAVAALQIASPFTKFCPVYFVLNKLMPDTEPIQNGK
ncbi:MAG: DUF2892 domain-containing protein [Flammeovirgaceae bacterium]|mgnify:FL=1|jgi:hypothetical protein|nr:DUF2892 domain-containing protein [Flammeovirgaceae bacterium]